MRHKYADTLNFQNVLSLNKVLKYDQVMDKIWSIMQEDCIPSPLYLIVFFID